MLKYIMPAFLLLIELYLFFIVKSVFSGVQLKIAIAIQTILLAFSFYTVWYVFNNLGQGYAQTTKTINVLIGLLITQGVFKLVFVVFMGIGDLARFFSYLTSLVSSSPADFPSRRKAVAYIGLGLAAIPFVSFLYGVFKTRYDFKVFKEILEFEELPDEFDGLRIVQFSDFHAGTFDDLEAVKKGLAMLQDLNADMIVFTGDLVNNTSEEFDKFIPYLKELSAPLGKFSILGNHDYGLYYNWESEAQKEANHQRIIEHHQSIGFDLLRNENREIVKNGAKLSLLGVENWGRPPFPPKGDLDKALVGRNEKEFNILLSHDPHHWEDKVIDHKEHIHLTLSGHTHGMQMGIDLPGFKWSPVSLRYKKWAGLYEEKGRYLYVNRGFGHIGFPGRVGIYPEVTLIEFKNKSKSA